MSTGEAPTSFYAIGSPNAVGAASFVNLYQGLCITQVSSDANVIRLEQKYEEGIIVLDDQARTLRKGNGTPEVRIVSTSQAEVHGRCICGGTIQLEAVIDPVLTRKSNMSTLLAAAGKWARARVQRAAQRSGAISRRM